MSENEVKEEAVVENVESAEKPKLWNPNAAVNWCLLFTPIFGAWLHSKNWKELGDEDKAKKSMYWVYAGIPVLLFTLLTSVRLSWVFLIVWYFVAARKQVKYVKDELGNEYERKLWKKPLKFGGVGFLIMVLVAGVFSLENTSGMLEEEAVVLVSQILEEQLGSDAAECILVKIDEQVNETYYRATATLNNGNDLSIMIAHEEDQIEVVIPDQ